MANFARSAFSNIDITKFFPRLRKYLDKLKKTDETNSKFTGASTRTVASRFYSSEVKKCTLIPGDGIGPEISASVQKIFAAAKVPIEWESVDVTPVKVSRFE
jgi:isocitrate dehydrogenase (NAD+)